MTDVVQFAPGFNNTGGLQDLPHQPTTVSPGIMYTVQRYGLSRKRADDGANTELRYPRIYVSWFNDLNTFFGFDDLTGVTSVEGTFHLRANDGNWYNFNGIAEFIINGSPTQRTFASWSQVVYKITGLRKI